MSEPQAAPGPVPPRRILHIDMDAFYASVEQRDRPELRGKPLIVGGRPESRGVVAAASYEARKFGIRSAMPSSQAIRLCPHAVIVPPAHAKYARVSQQIRDIFLRFTPLIEPVALDECFLDVTDAFDPWGSATALARHIQQSIRNELELGCSAGVAPSKFVAKVASDFRKPGGLVVVPPGQVLEFLEPLPARVLWGIGPKMNEKLETLGVKTVGDLRRLPIPELVARFGKMGYRLGDLARGVDPSSVEPNREYKQISRETTYTEDLADPQTVRDELLALAQQLGHRLEEQNIRFRSVHLKVRYTDFVTVTRSMTWSEPSGSTPLLCERALELLGRTEAGSRPIRLLGVGVAGLQSDSPQLQLPFR